MLKLLQKKHKKKSRVVENEAPMLLKEDHEEIDGENTPLQSPTETTAPALENNINKKPASEEKVDLNLDVQ